MQELLVKLAQARLEAIEAASDDAIVSTTLSGEVVSWNPGAERMFCFTAAEMTGQAFTRLVPKESHDIAVQHYLGLAQGKTFRHRTALLRQDGTQVQVSVTLSPLRHPTSSEILGVSLVARDVSPQVTIAESLRRSENRFGRLVDSNVVGVCIASAAGMILEANDNFLDLLGYQRHNLPFSWLDFIVPEGRPKVAELRQEVHRMGRVPLQEMEYVATDGHRVPVLFALAHLEEDQVLLMSLDLSSTKHLEQQLLHAQKMEEMGRLAGGVAHDFNNLLTVINGYCQLMQAQVSDQDPLREALDEVVDAGFRAARLTNQLLAFSRRQVLDLQPLHLNRVISNMSKMLRRILGEDIDFVTRLAPGLPPVRSDASQMEQVLMNLAVNARDAMPQGGKLTVATQEVVLDETMASTFPGLLAGPYIQIAVSDTGTGMDQATLAHVFEPFYTTKEQSRGSGLGLSTVYGIVRQSRGYISGSSEPGQGTTFNVFLPVCNLPVAPSNIIGDNSEETTGSKTILVVEDDIAIVKLLEFLLKDYTLLHASDGNQGLKLAETYKQPIHLLMADLVMPRMGGQKLAKKLTHCHPETRILYMSGFSDDSLAPDDRIEPGVAFMAKPFAPDVLLRKIRAMLGAT